MPTTKENELMTVEVGGYDYKVVWWTPGMKTFEEKATITTDTETELLIKGAPVKPVIAQVVCNVEKVIHIVWHTYWDEYFTLTNSLNPEAIWVFHNAAFDIKVLGDPREPENAWMMTLLDNNRVVDSGVRFALRELARGKFMGRWGMDYAAKVLLNLVVDKGKDKKEKAERLTFKQFEEDGVTPWSPSFEHIKYAAIDAAVTVQIYEAMPEMLPTEDICVKGNIALEDISDTGFLIDEELRQEKYEQYTERIAALESDLRLYGWNPGSGMNNTNETQSIMQYIEKEEDQVFPRTKGSSGKPAYEKDGKQYKAIPPKPGQIQMTDKALENLDDSFSFFIKDYKAYKHDTKVRGTYLESNSTGLDGKSLYDRIGMDGRVHPYFKGMVKTGRTSCSGPNIQNVPRAGGIRGIYAAPKGKLLFACDYSQAELCALAQHCHTVYGFSRMLEVINDGVDLHLWLGERIFYKENGMHTSVIEKKLSNFTEKSLNSLVKAGDVENAEIVQKWLALSGKERKQYRQLSKALNFGAPGGLGAPTFVDFAQVAYGVTLTRDEAHDLITFWKTVAFPEIQYHLSPPADGEMVGENDMGEKETYTVYRASTITGRVRRKASYCSACNYALKVAHVKPSEFGESHLTSWACNYRVVACLEVIPSEASQECEERVTTSAWSPERTVKHHERPARRDAVMI